MTNEKSRQHIKKRRDITLLTKVHIVKVMVFPVVMFGCKSWPIKKAESQLLGHGLEYQDMCSWKGSVHLLPRTRKRV